MDYYADCYWCKAKTPHFRHTQPTLTVAGARMELRCEGWLWNRCPEEAIAQVFVAEGGGPRMNELAFLGWTCRLPGHQKWERREYRCPGCTVEAERTEG